MPLHLKLPMACVLRPAIAAAFCFACAPAAWGEPRRGDANGDGTIDVSDAITCLGHLFLGSFTLACEPAADANDDGVLDVSDPIRITGFLFLGDAALPELSAGEKASCSTNLPPVISPRPLHRTYPGQTAELRIDATDPEDDPLHYEPVDLPPGARLDPAGLLVWTPGEVQLGLFQVRFAVLDGASPPNRVEGALSFLVQPLDDCTLPRCDPAAGCEADLRPLQEDCCGEPGARVAEPELGCPGGRALYAGRNAPTASTIGRLRNCDLFRLTPLGQGGHTGRLNVEVRCLDARDVDLSVRLETAATVLFEGTLAGARLEPTGPDSYEVRGLSFIAEGLFNEGQEAQLTVVVVAGPETLERKLRVILTRNPTAPLP